MTVMVIPFSCALLLIKIFISNNFVFISNNYILCVYFSEIHPAPLFSLPHLVEPFNASPTMVKTSPFLTVVVMG